MNITLVYWKKANLRRAVDVFLASNIISAEDIE